MSSNSHASTSDGTSRESTWNGDGVVPTEDALLEMLSRSERQWKNLSSRAHETRLIPGTVRLDCLLNHVPELPRQLRNIHSIAGKASWQLCSSHCDGPSTRTDAERQWRLSLPSGLPTLCSLSSNSLFTYANRPTNALAPLFLAWAYILSTCLLERQGIRTQYATPANVPRQAPSSETKIRRSDGSDEMYISIGQASAAERQWWRALVAPGHGWRPLGKRPPWTVAYTGNIRLHIVVNDPDAKDDRPDPETSSPPSSAQAMRYLMRFASVYDLDDQAMLALAMALTLPLHNETRSAVTLPKPCGLTLAQDSRQGRAAVHTPCIDDQCKKLGYYMTLSSNPLFLSSALWGIFWEPGIECNLVSAWLKPIHDIVGPLVQGGDVERLAHLLALRCPAVSPLWYGVLACGETKVFRKIPRFLATLQTPSIYRPVPEVAAWTRSPQSFMDLCGTGPYLAVSMDTHYVERADVWRLRHEFCGIEPSEIPFRNTPLCPWPPFGKMREDEIEPPIRRHFRCDRHEWAYASWTWVVGGKEQFAVRGLVTEKEHELSGRGEVQDSRLITEGQVEHFERALKLDQTASRQAVGDIFRWAATEMEPSGKAIYRHPWVEAQVDLSMGGHEEVEDTISSTKPTTEKKRLVEEWLSNCLLNKRYKT